MLKNLVKKFFPSGASAANEMSVKSASANRAKERLQIILAHQRGSQALEGVDLAKLQGELVACVQRHIKVAEGADVSMSVKQNGQIDVFEMQVPVQSPSRLQKKNL